MEEKKVPALRFRGFDNAWEQRRLGELADKVTEKNTLLAKTEVLTNSAEFGIINQREFFDHDIVNENNIGGYYIVRERDFVYNPRISVSAPVGPINCNKLGKSGVMSPLYTVFRVHDIDSIYLEYFFKTSRWHSFMRFNGDSGVRSDRFSIKTELFYKMPIPITKYCEQVKIGKYFSQLDNLISLHQRKLEMLKKVKKSMLEKMFPKNDAKVPEVRFSDFTDAWEQCKVNSLFEPLTERNDDLLPYSKTLSVATMTYKEVGNGAADSSLANYKRLRLGDVAFEGHTSKEFRYGRFVLNDAGDGIMSPRFSALRPISELPVQFWKYYIHYEPIMKRSLVNCTKAGTMMNELVVPEFLQESLLVPSTDEQVQIGKYFANLNHLIILHQRKLEKLKNIKKSMLEKMFII